MSESMTSGELSAKPRLLFLCHRIPYPPNKGDKIRSYHLLRYLSEHYQVCLGAFVDDPEDWVYAQKLEDLCEEVCLVNLNPKFARLKSLWGFCSGLALSLPFYMNGEMTRWVKQLLHDNSVERVVVYSAVMAQYVSGKDFTSFQKVADMVDIDSEKWREYSRRKSFPMSWVYRREADCLLKFEQHVALTFDHSLFVSKAEMDKFNELAPETANKVSSYSNGVDTDYFCPQRHYASPYKDDEKALVFTGAMDYWPNVDAVSWFVKAIFPTILAQNEQARFYIVGGNPTRQVRELAKSAGVVVTGRVEDIRPYLAHAALAIAPMRIARGIQNKVLEAMAMSLPVIVSESGLEGIDSEHGHELLLARKEVDYLTYTHDVLSAKYSDMGRIARLRVKQDFNWANNLPMVGRLLEGATL
jgi:sugar transferase (PEP-CTERM/EpsH1 system associated)